MALRPGTLALKAKAGDMTNSSPLPPPTDDLTLEDALQRISQKIVADGVLFYDGLAGSYREAADILISSRSVETEQDESGFVFMKPLPLVTRVLRGQNGENYLLRRLATGSLYSSG